MPQEKQIIVRYTIRPLPVRVYSSEKLKSDLVNGKLPLKDVPKKFRLRDKVYYIYAMKYYNYRQDIDNPYDVFYEDIKSLPEGFHKENLKDHFWAYGRDIGITYEQYENANCCLSASGSQPAVRPISGAEKSKDELSACIEEADALFETLKRKGVRYENV